MLVNAQRNAAGKPLLLLNNSWIDRKLQDGWLITMISRCARLTLIHLFQICDFLNQTSFNITPPHLV